MKEFFKISLTILVVKIGTFIFPTTYTDIPEIEMNTNEFLYITRAKDER